MYEEIENNELKPCPFCGGKPKLFKHQLHDFVYYFVHCEDCCDNPPKSTGQEAIDHWNTRET